MFVAYRVIAKGQDCGQYGRVDKGWVTFVILLLFLLVLVDGRVWLVVIDVPLVIVLP